MPSPKICSLIGLPIRRNLRIQGEEYQKQERVNRSTQEVGTGKILGCRGLERSTRFGSLARDRLSHKVSTAVRCHRSDKSRRIVRGRLKVMYRLKTYCPVGVDTRVWKGSSYGLVF